MVQTARPKPREQSGPVVIAAIECPADMEDDRRAEIISYLNDGRTFLNSDELYRRVMLAEVAGRMRPLVDRIVWVRAERRSDVWGRNRINFGIGPRRAQLACCLSDRKAEFGSRRSREMASSLGRRTAV